MIYQIATVIALVASASASSLYTEDSKLQLNMWKNFKATYAKKYSDAEETVRFNNFLENLKAADQRNVAEKKVGGTATHGVTKFSDMNQEEFRKQFLTASVSTKKDFKGPTNVMDAVHKVNASMGLVDWTGRFTTPVKDQVPI